MPSRELALQNGSHQVWNVVSAIKPQSSRLNCLCIFPCQRGHVRQRAKLGRIPLPPKTAAILLCGITAVCHTIQSASVSRPYNIRFPHEALHASINPQLDAR